MSKSYRVRAGKSHTCLRITDFIITTFTPQRVPCVLMWRELINAFHLSRDPDYPNVWPRDCDVVHKHWKQFGPGVVSVLTGVYDLTVVKISSGIRKLIPHGAEPRIGGLKYSAEAYRTCLPSSNAPTFGLVLFPPGMMTDHPLVFYSRSLRVKSSATAMRTSFTDLKLTNARGSLSDESASDIRCNVRPILRDVLTSDIVSLPAPQPGTFVITAAPASLPAPDRREAGSP
jgi:hypothetical protein